MCLCSPSSFSPHISVSWRWMLIDSGQSCPLIGPQADTWPAGCWLSRIRDCVKNIFVIPFLSKEIDGCGWMMDVADEGNEGLSTLLERWTCWCVPVSRQLSADPGATVPHVTLQSDMAVSLWVCGEKLRGWYVATVRWDRWYIGWLHLDRGLPVCELLLADEWLLWLQVLQLPQPTVLLQTHHAVWVLVSSAWMCRCRPHAQQVKQQQQRRLFLCLY